MYIVHLANSSFSRSPWTYVSSTLEALTKIVGLLAVTLCLEALPIQEGL